MFVNPLPCPCIYLQIDEKQRSWLDLEIKWWLWLKYMDDFFFIWTEVEDKLAGFLNCLNSFHPNLEFLCENSKPSVNFLDLNVTNFSRLSPCSTFLVSIVNDKLETDLYYQPTDCYQFHHFNSAHLFHNKKLIVYSQGSRIKRLCSSSLIF